MYEELKNDISAPQVFGSIMNLRNKEGKPKAKIFQVPFSLEGNEKEIIIRTFNSLSCKAEVEIFSQAINLHREGNIFEASRYYKYLLDKGFSDPRVLFNLGVILSGEGKLNEAEILIRNAIEIKHDYEEAHNNLGIILRDLGRLNEAEISFRMAIKIKKDYAEAYNNLGIIFRDKGELDKAEKLTKKAISINHNFAEAYCNLAVIKRLYNKLQEAEELIRKSIQIKPDYPQSHNNLGNILRDLGELNLAAKSTRKAISLNENFTDAYLNLGIILRDLGELNEAEKIIRKAIEINPNYSVAYLNLSIIELLLGNYKSGLEHYEFRDKIVPVYANPITSRLSDLTLPLKGKLLVVSEQGLGDTLQYMRYIPYLRENGIDVLFCPQKKLHSLIKASGIDPNPITPDEVSKISDVKWVRLLSLPKLLNINPQNPIIYEPYIYAKPEQINKWKGLLSHLKKPIIGINWQGNPTMEKTYQGRSIPLEDFSLIFENNNFNILSLQKGFGSDQLDNCSFKNKFVECQSQIDSTWDFLESAAIVHNCDLIITNDTSIAHLAGGMGKNVWLLLKDIPFWTWGIKGDSTFWYPSMRLFRQKNRNDWKEVMTRVSLALAAEFKKFS